jgi:Spy/CpxP family protein refolding chaperone
MLIMAIILGMSLCILIQCTGTVYGQGGPLRNGKQGEPGSLRGPEARSETEMGLTPEQQEKLKNIRTRYEEKAEDIQFEIRSKKIEMVKLLRAPSPERKMIDQKLEELLKLEGARQRLYVDEYFEVRKLLTPEQARIFTRKTIRAIMKN